MQRRVMLAATALAVLRANAAGAQGTRPVRLVVPAAPGGAIDVIGRIYAQRLSARGQPRVVDNRAGGNNTIGAAEVARAAPDGQTLLVNADIHPMGARVVRGLRYDPVADFTPIARLAIAPLVIVGHPEASRACTLGELVEQMRCDPRRCTLASSGAGSMAHLAAEALKRRVGAADAGVAQYRGTAPAITDVVAGNVALMMVPLPSAQANALGVILNEIGRDAEIVTRLAALGADAFTQDTPSSFTALIATESVANGRIADEVGSKPE